MIDEQYVNPRLAAIYDAESGWSEDRQFYLELAGELPIDILDFGCGTGLIANAYAAKGHRVTGADPAKAMLDEARQSPLGDRITWTEATAQSFRSDQKFDLIIMTGHAFQVLLEPLDVAATFANVRALLKPEGRFVFETRNRKIDWVSRWTHEKTLKTKFGLLKITRQVLEQTEQRIRFSVHYAFDDGAFDSESELHFWTESEVRTFAAQAGMSVDAVCGDWVCGAFDIERSEEMVFVLTA